MIPDTSSQQTDSGNNTLNNPNTATSSNSSGGSMPYTDNNGNPILYDKSSLEKTNPADKSPLY